MDDKLFAVCTILCTIGFGGCFIGAFAGNWLLAGLSVVALIAGAICGFFSGY